MNNLYVKICLTAIVLLLTSIVLKPILSPSIVEAQRSSNAVQISAQGNGGFLLYDNNTGRIWSYDIYIEGVGYWGRVAEPGKPLAKDLPTDKR